MLTERECWERIEGLAKLAVRDGELPNTAYIERLKVYIDLILIRRRVEALEE